MTSVLRLLTATVGLCLFNFNQIQSANTTPSQNRYRWPGGVIPFVIIQLIALVALWELPQLATALPHAEPPSQYSERS